jgi:hypothetical protein
MDIARILLLLVRHSGAVGGVVSLNPDSVGLCHVRRE